MAEGKKFDKGKPRYDLIPPEALEALAQLFAMGAEKYGDRNWEAGMTWGRIYRAMMGHANKFWMGEWLDQEDGQPHLTSVMWCAMVLFNYAIHGIGTDDRSHLRWMPEADPSHMDDDDKITDEDRERLQELMEAAKSFLSDKLSTSASDDPSSKSE